MKKRYITILLAASALAVVAAWGMPALVKNKMGSVLNRYGFSQMIIPAMERRDGGIAFDDIRLDKDGFSTIGSIRARLDWMKLLTPSGGAFPEIVVDNLILTGEMKDDGGLDIAGWTPPSLLDMPAIAGSVVVNGGQLDLDTQAGAIRLEAKGRTTGQPDGGRKTEAAIWGKQHQLVLDSRWSAAQATDGAWTAGTEIRDLRVNLPWLSVTRASGWLSFEALPGNLPSTTGQLAAGRVDFGSGAVIENANLTIDSPADGGLHIILDGAATNQGALDFSFEITLLTAGPPRIRAALGGTDIDGIIDFLSSFNDAVQAMPVRDDLMTSLLITPGNLDRVRKSVKKINYDKLDLIIDGTPGDMTGKIVTRGKDGAKNDGSIVSLNPAPQ